MSADSRNANQGHHVCPSDLLNANGFAEAITQLRRQHAGCLVMPISFTDPAIICAGLSRYLNYSLFAPNEKLSSLVLALPHEGAECRYVLARATAPMSAPLESALLQIESASADGIKFTTLPHKPIQLTEAFAVLLAAGSEATTEKAFNAPLQVMPIQALRSPQAFEAYKRGLKGGV